MTEARYAGWRARWCRPTPYKGRLRSVVERRRQWRWPKRLTRRCSPGPVDAGTPPAHDRRCRRRGTSGCSGSPRYRARTGASPTSTTSASRRRGAAKAMRGAPSLALDDEARRLGLAGVGLRVRAQPGRGRALRAARLRADEHQHVQTSARGGAEHRPHDAGHPCVRVGRLRCGARTLGGHPGVGEHGGRARGDRALPAAQPGPEPRRRGPRRRARRNPPVRPRWAAD